MYAQGYWWHVRVRIKVRPRESELDGVRLDGFAVGTTRDVSTSIGSWLVAQGYADLEMRSSNETDGSLNGPGVTADSRRRADD